MLQVSLSNLWSFFTHISFLLIQDDLREMEEFPGPFLVDNMEDEASKLYGAHPERLYIILDGKIVYQVSYFQEFNLSIEMCLHNTIFRAVQGPLTMFQMRSIVGWRSTLVRCLELHNVSFMTS